MKEVVTKTIMVNSGGETGTVSKLVEKAVRSVFDAHKVDGVVDINVEPKEAHKSGFRLYVFFSRIERHRRRPKCHDCDTVDYKDGENLLTIKVHANVADMTNPDNKEIAKTIVDEIIDAIQEKTEGG